MKFFILFQLGISLIKISLFFITSLQPPPQFSNSNNASAIIICPEEDYVNPNTLFFIMAVFSGRLEHRNDILRCHIYHVVATRKHIATSW